MIRLDNPFVSFAAACIFLLSAAGCRKAPPPVEQVPSERLLVVKPAAAPGLTEAKPGQRSKRTVHQGEVLTSQGKAGAFHWEGELEGQQAVRDGDLLETTRSGADAPTYVFASDVAEAEVPAASWVCNRLGNPVLLQVPCVQGLRRLMLSEGRMLAFIQGAEPVCPVALRRGSELDVVDVIGLGDARVLTMGGREVVVAWSRWVRGQDWTGTDLVVMETRPKLHKIGQVPTEEADARKPDEITNRMGTLHVGADGIRFEGKRRVYERATGKEKSAVDFVETWRVTPEGTFEQTRN